MANSASNAVDVSDSDEQMSSPEAYEQLLPEIRAVAEESLIHINLDILLVVTTVLGALPEIRTLRPRMLEEVPKFDIARFDKLELMARALSHAHAQYVAATKPAESLPALVDEATKLRDTLHQDATALANRGLLDPARFKDVKRNNGYRALALDLQVLSLAMKEKWPQISTKTAVVQEELERAVSLADRLQLAVGLREQGPTGVEEAASIRQRAFTLFMRTYEDARRAVSYLRWHEGDEDTIAPSLYTLRQTGTRRRPEDDEPAPAPTPIPAPESQRESADEGGAAVSVGLPGSNPFARA